MGEIDFLNNANLRISCYAPPPLSDCVFIYLDHFLIACTVKKKKKNPASRQANISCFLF